MQTSRAGPAPSPASRTSMMVAASRAATGRGGLAGDYRRGSRAPTAGYRRSPLGRRPRSGARVVGRLPSVGPGRRCGAGIPTERGGSSTMATTPANGTDDRARRPAAPARPMALVTWAFVLLVLVIVVVLLVVKVTRGTTTTVPPPVAPAPASVVQAAATSSPAPSSTRWAPPPPTAPCPVVLSGQPAAGCIDGRPGVVYVGSEFCPYCAADRWALVVALSRFGTFAHLGATSRRPRGLPRDARPSASTAPPTGAATSRFVGRRGVRRPPSATAPAGFPLLHHPAGRWPPPSCSATAPPARARDRHAPLRRRRQPASSSTGRASASHRASSRDCRWPRSPPTCPTRPAPWPRPSWERPTS